MARTVHMETGRGWAPSLACAGSACRRAGRRVEQACADVGSVRVERGQSAVSLGMVGQFRVQADLPGDHGDEIDQKRERVNGVLGEGVLDDPACIRVIGEQDPHQRMVISGQ